MISAVVLAAGLSSRMGAPKMVLPWGKTTVIGQVVEALFTGGVEDVVVVTGGASEQVEEAILGTAARTVLNPLFANGEMLPSLQAGLKALTENCAAVLLALGDQPQIQAETVKKVIERYRQTQASLIVPSYEMRRGHPWLIERALWPEILQMQSPQTMRNFLQGHGKEIYYLVVDTPTILQDLDTPEEYLRQKPQE